MSEKLKIKFQQIIHALDVLVYNQRLLRDNINEDDLFALVKCYTDQRKVVKQLENQLKSVTLKTKSQSQQIHDQQKRRLNSSNRANRLHKTVGQIYNLINYDQHTSPIDQLHYIKKICEDRLRDDKSSSDDEDELDSHNCTIDDDHNESLIIPPRVVLPQSSTKKRLLDFDDNDKDLQKIISPPKRLRLDDSQQFITKTTFECYNTTRPLTITTDIKMIDNSSSSSSTTESTSSIEQTLPFTHRFISKKIFKPETCFVCLKRINFGSVSYRCSYCSQSTHINCKENANSNCKILSNNAMLPPYSPKTPTISTLKTIHRQRMVCSEPRKISTKSTIQRHLPFERMILLK